MKLQNFILVAAAAVAMSSCSNEELDSNLLADSNAISFNAVANKASRATIVNATSDIKDFTVDAFTDKGVQYMTGTKIVNSGTTGSPTWDYADEKDVRYWPNTGTLDFYALSPATIDDTAVSYGHSFGDNGLSITYTADDEYSTENSKANTDVMYAVAGPQSSGVVNLQFHHILSQVMFKAKTEAVNDFVVNINQIKICNVRTTGTISLCTTETPINNWVMGDETKSYVVVTGKSLEINSSTTATGINLETPLLMVPQGLTAWVPGDSNINSEEVKSYLAIKCKIKQAGQYLVGSDAGYTEIYVPFGTEWQSGKRYTYTLTFGGGYDSEGNPILKPITFTAEVEEWVDVEDDVNAI